MEGRGVGPHCSFCGATTGPLLEVGGGRKLLMCGRCQAARGQGPDRLEAAYHPGHPYLHWTCALCSYQVFWGRDLEAHTAQHHPGWTAEFEVLRPYPHQRLRVAYRRSDDPRPGA
jgi:hypothetical protein